MKSLFEPLLDNLLQVAASPVQLLDQSGQILYKQVPRGCNDLALSDPERFESEQKRMQQVSCPVCLSSAGMEQEVAGWYFPDGATLLIGPVERRSTTIPAPYLRPTGFSGLPFCIRSSSISAARRPHPTKSGMMLESVGNMLSQTISWLSTPSTEMPAGTSICAR